MLVKFGHRISSLQEISRQLSKKEVVTHSAYTKRHVAAAYQNNSVLLSGQDRRSSPRDTQNASGLQSQIENGSFLFSPINLCQVVKQDLTKPALLIFFSKRG